MSASEGYVDHVKDLLAPLGTVGVRRMFGGAGVYCGGVMFALIADDTLYLKSDAATDPAFAAEGCEPFTYSTKDGRNTVMSYRRAPERLFDEPDEMVAWARQAIDVALRSGGPRNKHKARRD